jgi:transaldolase
MTRSVIERLIETNPDMEIWWDSSPLIFEPWVQKMVKRADPARKATLEEELNRIFVLSDPAQSLIRGCTTNPPLSLEVVKTFPDVWSRWVDEAIEANPTLDYKQIAWLTYKEIVKRGAQALRPIYEASKGRYGFVSGQLDPRLFKEVEVMVEAADELRALSPNVMIKVPGSTQGIEVLKILASKGIPTNTTTCFSLPQIMASANATNEGMKIAEKTGVDLSKWRAVITMMIGRLTEHPVLDQQAERRGIKLTWQDKHWWGIGVFRKAYELLTERGLPSKLLACSMRQGPLVAGKMRFWDVEAFAGGDIVYTCPPYVFEPLFEQCNDIRFRPQMHEPIPQEVWDKILRIPYGLQNSFEYGLDIDQFNDHPATIATVAAFSKALDGIEGFVKERLTYRK